jgi:heparin binding hemagglutinin HbhA
MATTNDSHRPSLDPLLAVVGVTDLAVKRVRAAVSGASHLQAQLEARVSAAQAGVEKRVAEFDPQALRAQAQEVPNRAAAFALTTASKASTRAEAAYDELARRGRSLLERIGSQQATQDLIAQAGNTISRGRAAVTVARRAADETTTAVLTTLNVSRREASALVEDTQARAETAAKKTQASARKTTTTARKRATATKSAAKGAETSARKTATKARAATRAAAKKVGD